MIQCKLTTIDNPYDPFEDFDNWFMFDIEMGYYSCSKLDREANVPTDATEIESNAELERAIDEIVKNDFTDKFIKATRMYPDLDDESISIEELNNLEKDLDVDPNNLN